jgi:hypothetical protein
MAQFVMASSGRKVLTSHSSGPLRCSGRLIPALERRMNQPIIERFQITGRGLVVVVANTTKFASGSKLRATVVNPDGSRFTVNTFKEMMLRRLPVVNEHEAYLLQGLSQEQIQDGACVEVVAL